jgi:hypothetical protein
MSGNPFAEPKADLDYRVVPEVSDAERIRREHLRAETNIKSIGMLYLIGGGLGTIGGVIGLVAGAVELIRNRSSFGAMEGALIAMLVLIYPAIFAAGIGLRRFQTWARWVAVALSAIGLLGIPFGTLFGILFLYWLLNSKATTVFTPEYQEIIRQTPHIQYKTSPVAWAALGLIVLLVIACVIAAIAS